MQILKRSEDKEKGSEDVTHDFYMKQTKVLDNACGIIACLHAVYNNLSWMQIEEGSVI
jgi:ubiquitin carboxyl-terminal hydrolase L3